MTEAYIRRIEYGIALGFSLLGKLPEGSILCDEWDFHVSREMDVGKERVFTQEDQSYRRLNALLLAEEL